MIFSDVILYLKNKTKQIFFHLSTELNLSLTATRQDASVQLLCTVKPAVDLVADILFVRRSGNSTVTCAHIAQQVSNCHVVVQESDYHPFCSPEAYSSNASVKTYTLEIPRLNAEDYAEWWCQTKNRRQTHNTVTLVDHDRINISKTAGGGWGGGGGGIVPQSDLSSTLIVSRCYNDLSSTIIVSTCYNDFSSTIIVSRCYNDLGFVPQSDLSSTIIVSRCCNDHNFVLQLTACSTKKTLPYGHRRLRL